MRGERLQCLLRSVVSRTMALLEVSAILLAVASLLLALAYRTLTSSYDYFEKRGISGPKPVFFFGTWWGLWNKFFGDEDLNNVRKYGKVFGTFDGRTPNLVAADPELAKLVLVEQADKFTNHRAQCVRDPLLRKSLQILGKCRASESEGYAVSLSKEKIRKLVPRILKTTNQFIDAVKEEAKSSEGRVNITDLLSSYIGDTIINAVFGQELEESTIDRQTFSNSLNLTFYNKKCNSIMSTMPFIYPSLVQQDTFIIRKRVSKYILDICKTAIEQRLKVEKQLNEGKSVDLVDLLIAEADAQKLGKEDEKETEGKPFDAEGLAAQNLAVLLNTSLTARSTVGLSVAYLASHSDIQDKLFSSLTKHLQLEPHEITAEVLQNEYLDMFLSEVLRIHPIEFRLEQGCVESVEYDNNKIEKGTIVSIPIYAIHRNEEFYPEPDTFNPERFSKENESARRSFTYFPYGQAGSNSANASVQFALLVVKLAVVSLIKNFKFSPSGDTSIPPLVQTGITGVVRHEPVILKAEERK